VVDAAAILGRRISFDLLAAVTGSGEDELIAILRHLVAENVMVEEEPDLFAFRHALTREAIGGRLLGRERRRLHEKALAALQETGAGDWAAIAWHAQGAGRYEEMVEAARTGAWSYLQQGSTAEALRLAETGLSEADHDPDLLAAASKAAWMIGLLPLAIEHGRGWHAQAAAGGDPAAEAAALVHLARLYWEARDFQRQWQTVWAALRVAEPLGESEPLARAYSLAAEAHMLNEQHAEAVRWADKALAMAEAVGCPAVRAAALVNKGTALADRVDGHDEGVALLERAVAEAEAGDFGYVLHRALYNLLVQQVDVWPPERSRRVLQRMRETGERTGRGSEAPGWALHRSEIAIVEGDLEAALASSRDARRSDLVPVEGWIDPCWIDLIEVALLLEAGRLDQAEALLRRHDDRTGAEGDPYDTAWLWAVRLRMAAARGRLDAVRALLRGRPPAPPCTGWSPKPVIHTLLGLAAALRAGLPPAEARSLLDAVVPTDPGDDGRPSPRRTGRRRLEATLLEAEGDPAAALDAYRQVLDHHELYRAPFLLVDCH
jgi:tetratricopeptide (TPR) repeat protein